VRHSVITVVFAWQGRRSAVRDRPKWGAIVSDVETLAQNPRHFGGIHPASHAGAGSSGSDTAQSASLMSEGRERALSEIPPGQHRHATSGTGAGWTSRSAAG
jgi:hypothetical protein